MSKSTDSYEFQLVLYGCFGKHHLWRGRTRQFSEFLLAQFLMISKILLPVHKSVLLFYLFIIVLFFFFLIAPGSQNLSYLNFLQIRVFQDEFFKDSIFFPICSDYINQHKLAVNTSLNHCICY